MLEAIAVVVAAAFGAAVSVLGFLIGGGALVRIEKLSTVIEKTEPSQERDALVALRNRMIQSYIRRASAPVATRAARWLVSGAAVTAVGLFGTVWLPQFLADVTQVSNADDLRPINAITGAVSMTISCVGVVVGGIGLVKLLRSAFID